MGQLEAGHIGARCFEGPFVTGLDGPQHLHIVRVRGIGEQGDGFVVRGMVDAAAACGRGQVRRQGGAESRPDQPGSLLERKGEGVVLRAQGCCIPSARGL